MKITRDVVTDLLPLYFGEEASADSRAVVEAFFAQDPEFARLARTHPEASLPQAEPATPLKETEMQTLQRTRKLLRFRGGLVGIAAFLTLLPLSFRAGDESGFAWLFLDQPVALTVIAFLAAAAWAAYFALRHRLRTAGV